MSHSNKQIAVVGCGYWGKNIVRNFAELGFLATICDPDERNTAPLVEKHDVEVRSLDSIIEDPYIKGIAIASPAPMHAEMATRALNAGKHVMVEKPIALSVEDAEKLVALAAKKDRLLMVGHLLNYHSGFLKIAEMVESGALGPLRRIYSNRLSLGKLRQAENVLWSFAPHDFSMISRLADGQEPTDVHAFGGSHVTRGIADFCHVHMNFSDNLKAHVFVSWLHPFKEQKLVVIGEDGMVVFDDTQPIEQKVALYNHKLSVERGIPKINKALPEFQNIQHSEPLKNECLSFVQGMEDRSIIYTNGEEGLRVLSLLSRAEESLQSNM
jgi:predicted dehydrogenase